jgi:hypothetical protein
MAAAVHMAPAAGELAWTTAPMLRITTHEAPDQVAIRCEGRLAGECVAVLAEELARVRVLAGHRPLALRLCGLRFVDEPGLALLRGLTDVAIDLSDCSSFLRALLPATPAPAGTPRTTP